MLLTAIIGKGKKGDREKEKPIYERTSFNEIRTRYKDDFFTKNLNIPEDQIATFLYYCDDQLPSEDIFTKKNEFLMIDFMVKHSKAFLESIKTKD